MDRLIQVFEVHVFFHQRIQAGEYLFTSYYSLPFLAGLLSTLPYLFCNCAILCWSDKGTMKQGHRLSCKHLDAILARAIVAVLSVSHVSLCVSGGRKPPTGDEPRPSRQRLRKTDSLESLQLFLRGRRGELLIECECKLQRLLIWPWLERRTPGAGGMGVPSVEGLRGRQPLSHPHNHIPTHLASLPPF